MAFFTQPFGDMFGEGRNLCGAADIRVDQNPQGGFHFPDRWQQFLKPGIVIADTTGQHPDGTALYAGSDARKRIGCELDGRGRNVAIHPGRNR